VPDTGAASQAVARNAGAPAGGGPDPMMPVRYAVAARRAQTTDVVTLALAPLDVPIDEPAPGQFTMIWRPGVGEIPVSVTGRPSDDGHLVHTIRSVGAVSGALCALDVGDVVGVRGPFGRGWDVAAAHGGDAIVIAGGIGFAPLRPVARHLVDHRGEFERVAVLVGARTPDDLIDVTDLEQWRGRFDVQVEITVDRAASAWRGDVGLVTSLLRRVRLRPGRATAFLCGPEVMIRHTALELSAAGVAAERIQVSLERNMQCAIRRCGHCQLGPLFVCADGPVVPWSVAGPLLEVPRL
jgi:anaerobic sulfite reductase subunit B